MKALVMDFDGVVSDSAREAFAVALRSYLDLRPGSELGSRGAASLCGPFLELMPLGNRAEDYGTALDAIEAGARFPDQAAYDAFRASRDAGWLRAYHERFYAVRAAMAEADPGAWLALMKPYPEFVDVLRRRAGAATYAIATSKDRASVERLLDAYGIADLIPPALVMDKQAGTRKTGHLERLHGILGIAWGQMTFIDDKVNHLEDAAALGARCALAGWGYNGPREHELARRRGFVVCSLESVEADLFGGAGRAPYS